MSDTGSDDRRSPFPPILLPPQGEKNKDIGTSFGGVPIQLPLEGCLSSGGKVTYRTPLAQAAGRGVLDSVGAPYIENGEIIVPKEGGHQNAYRDVGIVAINTESATAQGFLKYLEAWSGSKAASTKEKVKPTIDLLKTKGEVIGRLGYTLHKLFGDAEGAKVSRPSNNYFLIDRRSTNLG
ncbi:hypothetical protein TREMEDRAFT_61555 [Tremella mesenterica DSM 1558]|uniref:uncharacterized protein n=1 Tax=Tremella mesenterica (strain ATCC 24925 / CBS 8224 / DSM 1558 / NBRC 9311 / NRRL Y-6157 / RJB 2259-6 / UBC 559-6) TaxID=578456 RepID=UPI0003F490D2|nr:uncharacterized protein TREMEDRAFT_61555 [Tremella mesenterica DSM 1558]EIW69786.1 hypothetical protein TREMEDRAFT_61555 [Tremella mesenterica DSM 1558]